MEIFEERIKFYYYLSIKEGNKYIIQIQENPNEKKENNIHIELETQMKAKKIVKYIYLRKMIVTYNIRHSKDNICQLSN